MEVKILLICSMLLKFTSAKITMILDEGFEKCVEPEEDANVFDFSNAEIVAESDTDVYFNGSVKFLKKVESPWFLHIYTEKFERGEWNVYAMNRKIKDFCAVLHNPLEVWYRYSKNLKGCPLAAGVSSHKFKS